MWGLEGLQGIALGGFLLSVLSLCVNLAVCMPASLSPSLCKMGTYRKTVVILSPLTLAGSPQRSGVAPTGLANPHRVSQPVRPALVHCLGVARGYCEAELSPALPGTPQRGLAPTGGREEALGSRAGAGVEGWEMGWNRSPERSQPLPAYHQRASQFRPDPLLHSLLKPNSRLRGQGETEGASPRTSLAVPGCQQ